MKNIFFSATTFLLMSLAATAQTTPAKPQTPVDTVKPVKVDKYNTHSPAVLQKSDDNLPAHLKGATSSSIQPKHFLPVLGIYGAPVIADTVMMNTTEVAPVKAKTVFQPIPAEPVTIVVDEKNVGFVWIEGLPQGRIKAIMKKGPATYKIPAQKTSTGKSITEGTLIYDKETNLLWIAIGATYNDEKPTTPFTTKTKAKVWQLSKVETEVAVENPANQQ